METQKVDNMEVVKERSTSAAVQEPKFEVNATKFANFKKWEQEAFSEWESYPIEVNDQLLEEVPKSQHKALINAIKGDVINIQKAKAKEQLTGINSPFRYKKEAEIRINARNFLRQREHYENQLKNMVGDSIEEGEKVTKKYEVKFLIEKLGVELSFLKRDVELYGMDWEEITKDL